MAGAHRRIPRTGRAVRPDVGYEQHGIDQRPRPPRRSTSAPADRQYLLERVDEAAVVQLYADGFRDLPLREKTLIWHLSQAAIAGRDIFYDQRYAHNLEMRDVLEAIVTHPERTSIRATLAEIQRYTKLFWINTGPYNNLTARKFVLDLHAGRASPPRRTRPNAHGARFPLRAGETLDALLARLRPMFFDPDVRSDGHEQDAARRPGHPHRQRQQPLRRRDDEGPRGVRRAVSAELAAREARRPAGRRGLPRRRPLRRADRRDRRAPRGGRSRSRPSRWRRRCAR